MIGYVLSHVRPGAPPRVGMLALLLSDLPYLGRNMKQQDGEMLRILFLAVKVV